MMGPWLNGIIKWFDNEKGFGFLAPLDPQSLEPTDEEVFVHHTAIIGPPHYHKVHRGVLVRYQAVQNEKGLAASQVEPVCNRFEKQTDFSVST